MTRIAFRYADTRLFARLVCWWRGGDSAHCEVVSHSWTNGHHECISASWLDGGVRTKTMPLPADRWRIYEVEHTVDPVGWLELNNGAGYDWLGLLSFVIARWRVSTTRWFCSEVAAHIMGLPEPHRYDLVTLESVCACYGRRVQ